MDRRALRAKYESRRDSFEQLKEEAWYRLDREIKRKKIRIHDLYATIKPFDSFADKVAEKRVKRPFTQIHDIVGLRVVCLFLSDIQETTNIIKHTFQVVKRDDKIATIGADVFGYLAVHFDARLGTIGTGLQYKLLRRMTFEIQARTITHDAWASISWYLDYKAGGRIPDHLKRDFYALSGLFYVADTHFDLLRPKY